MISQETLNRTAKHHSMLRYPHHATEFEVQAYLWVNLINAGYLARGEVNTHHCRSRFDVVIFERSANANGKKILRPVRIIEVKRSPNRGGRQQVDRYFNDYGVPVDFVRSVRDAKAYMERIKLIIPIPELVDRSDMWQRIAEIEPAAPEAVNDGGSR